MTLRTERRLIPSTASSTRYVLAEIIAPEAPRTQARLPVNVALVLDRSGSMGGQKIELARNAVARALTLLRPTDRFSLVAYDEHIDVVVPSTLATGEARRNALHRLDHIDARGSTNLEGGWRRAAEQVAGTLTADAVHRCLVVTDGLANVGVTDHGTLVQYADELRRQGISTSAFGVGADFDERLLQQIADAGGGHFYYIEQAVQIPDLLASELGETLEVVARDTALIAQIPDGVRLQPLQTLPINEAGRLVRIELGDLVSAQELQVVVKVSLPAGGTADHIGIKLHLVDREGVLDTSVDEVSWSVASDRDNERQPRDRVVDRAVAALRAAQARQAALELNRAGRFDDARQLLERVAAELRADAGHDAALLAIARKLLEELEVFAACMSPVAMKRVQFASYAEVKMRTVEGKARRRRSPTPAS